jgi:hypothetical protein
VSAELANVYMGGNSPTDHALQLAAKNLNASWAKGQLDAGIDLARKNLTIRLNSIRSTTPWGYSETNPYGREAGGVAAPQAPAAAPTTPSRVYYDSNGNPIKK